jgi:hypothetical protein
MSSFGEWKLGDAIRNLLASCVISFQVSLVQHARKEAAAPAQVARKFKNKNRRLPAEFPATEV